MAASSGQQGRSPLVVPSFVSTFAALVPSSSTALAGISQSMSLGKNPLPFVASIPQIPELPSLGQPFIVGPGCSPIPVKLVAQISAGK